MGDSMSTIINATTTNGVVIQPDNSGSLVLQTNSGTTAVTISTAQNVGIGTSSPSGKFHVANTGTAGTTADNLAVYFSSTNRNSNVYIQAKNTEGSYLNFGDVDNVSIGRIGYEHSLDYMKFDTNATERMRIDSSGNVLVNTTSVISAGKLNINFPSGTDGIDIKFTNASNNGSFIGFFNSTSGLAGVISQTGATTVAYTTSSDYRLKENIVPMTGALDKVLQLKPVTYTWKQDGLDGQGFIAHELQAVVPDAVVGEKDAVDAEGNPKYQGVDTSFLVATLTAAIQEQQTIINDLKARVETLETK
jgi:hypothetical protein